MVELGEEYILHDASDKGQYEQHHHGFRGHCAKRTVTYPPLHSSQQMIGPVGVLIRDERKVPFTIIITKALRSL